jgi:uncharacterized protein YutE (UPF0331/DUF86 family)
VVDKAVLANKIASVKDAVATPAASGLRNLIAHQYGALDLARIHEIASSSLEDLLDFCEALARKA